MEKDQEIHDLIVSLVNRVSNLEEGFTSTHDAEGLYERLRGLEKFRRVVKWCITTAVAAAISAGAYWIIR